MMKKLLIFLLVLSPFFTKARTNTIISDSLPVIKLIPATKIYFENNGDSFTCNKPKTFDFLTHIPKDGVGYVKQSFQKKNLYKVGIVAASTALLIIFDQQITDGVQKFGRQNGISGAETYNNILSVKLFGKPTVLGKWPLNINTAFYNLGQGSTVVYMAAGFFLMGKIKHDNLALQTASQLIESFLALGAGTQILKYSTGRENPTDITAPGGRWRPFPSFSNFQSNKPKYDAFPSGHLATFVNAVTIISTNYPNKKWIAPVGYTIAGMLGLAMLNNGVHWAGDYPLGFALGYGYGKFIAKKSHIRVLPVQ